ncbi:GlxA family transcriptional regulator [Pelagibius sp. Alg239-R121]|uniref:GlxA family transcriptional regulator n=1 Tax=Pelagibius sp. Alg239-R121 TaxID=2993448 RepID=UPI0024A793D7|nr:GlxA family transcriptional regulator [Pelagibius sp. Alg239-R121]
MTIFSATSPDRDHPLELELLLLPDTSMLLLAAIVEPLRGANRLMDRQVYNWRLSSPDGMPVTTISGFPISVSGSFDPTAKRDALIVIAGYNIASHASRDLIGKLRKAGRKPAVIGGIESGAWLLAMAGLLDGYKATTHWEDLEAFEARFPKVVLQRDRFVIDGNRFTTGGATPALDMALELIRRRQGHALAMDVASLFIYEDASLPSDPQRSISLGQLATREPRVATAVRLMESHIEDPLTVSQISEIVGLSSRRLETLFKSELGQGPRAYYLAQRLNTARRQLTAGAASAIQIATSCGFNSAAAFSRAYRARYGESPTDTRRKARQAQS